MCKIDIEEVNSVIGMAIPESAEYDTLSGYVLEQIGRIPNENEEFTIDGFDILVKTKEGNRIREYIVRPTTKPSVEVLLPPATKNLISQ